MNSMTFFFFSDNFVFFSLQHDFIIKPQATPPLDTSEWPLLLKVRHPQPLELICSSFFDFANIALILLQLQHLFLQNLQL